MKRPKLYITLTIVLLLVIYWVVGSVLSFRIVIDQTNLETDVFDLSVVHLTDTHFLDSYNEKKYMNAIDEANELNPQIVFFTGDMFQVEEVSEELETLITTFFSSIECSEKYAVLGNHDYRSETKEETIIRILTNSGFVVLKNQNVEVDIDGTSFNLIGLDDLMLGDSKYDDVLATTSNYDNNIVLSHEPDTFNLVNPLNVFAMFSGHSHGGQVRFPFVGSLYNVPGAKEYYDEHYYINETHLYISFGLGESFISYRFNNPRRIDYYEFS